MAGLREVKKKGKVGEGPWGGYRGGEAQFDMSIRIVYGWLKRLGEIWLGFMIR